MPHDHVVSSSLLSSSTKKIYFVCKDIAGDSFLSEAKKLTMSHHCNVVV